MEMHFSPPQAGIFTVERAAAGGKFWRFLVPNRWNTFKNHRIWFPQTKKFQPAAGKNPDNFYKTTYRRDNSD